MAASSLVCSAFDQAVSKFRFAVAKRTKRLPDGIGLSDDEFLGTQQRGKYFANFALGASITT